MAFKKFVAVSIGVAASCAAVAFAVPGDVPDQKIVVAIQPMDNCDAKLVGSTRQQILDNYNVEVVVRPHKPIPRETYYPPRARYRADKLTAYLDRTDRGAKRVLGLTTKDISVTKGQYPDWGVLGYSGGRTCVVSTFRMRGSKHDASQETFRSRFAKVVSHELGHTFGLEHCPNRGCLMEDYKGTVRTVDQTHDFCTTCKAHLKTVLKGGN